MGLLAHHQGTVPRDGQRADLVRRHLVLGDGVFDDRGTGVDRLLGVQVPQALRSAPAVHAAAVGRLADLGAEPVQADVEGCLLRLTARFGPDHRTLGVHGELDTHRTIVLSRVLLLTDFHFTPQYPMIDLLDSLEFFLDVLPEAVTDLAVMTLDNDVHGNLHRSATSCYVSGPPTARNSNSLVSGLQMLGRPKRKTPVTEPVGVRGQEPG